MTKRKQGPQGRRHKIVFHRQEREWSCGAAVFRMILAASGQRVSEATCRRVLKTNEQVGTGVRAFGSAARRYGLVSVEGRNASLGDLKELLRTGWQIIVGYYLYEEGVSHYAILKGIAKGRVALIDPYYGEKHSLTVASFRRRWNRRMVDDPVKAWYFAVRKADIPDKKS